MTGRPLLSLALAAAGLLTLTGAVGWWWATYREVYAYSYLSLGQAGLCLVGDSEICRLATSLCRGKHASIVTVYSSSILWLGLALVSVSLVMPTRSPWAPQGSTDRDRTPRPGTNR